MLSFLNFYFLSIDIVYENLGKIENQNVKRVEIYFRFF
jgi:hypothetical protein